ncbi:MAG TPA: 16S rRNA (uracil(1498)-N(3))-methyltransferase, partial [Stenotrophomonas sp.]|nr:16S rRNA (uracil(1498)-N(3))-methyltransferase [Stenotrophomonas sp.]
MRVTRCHVQSPLAVGQTLSLPEDAANHLVRVMRLRQGDGCVLFNGD